ncbi:DMT family transporter [Gemmobacter serpentinus]|uniref:DMT family transporter n=1 Tax=Gemmobacter serpentinus TaxID=2652247 RepID=UPI00124F19BD|nr:DMT family transporter [Gemmobacter serpentinus]
MSPVSMSPASTAPASMSAFRANLFCLLSMIAWAMGLPAADLLIGLVPPLPLAAARLGVAAIMLVPFWLMVEGAPTLGRAPWWRGTLIGLVMLGLPGLLIVVAQARTDAVTVAVISATSPIIGITLETLFDGRRITPALVIGLGLTLAGGVFALSDTLGQVEFGLGALAAFGSVFFYTLGSRLTITSLPGMSPLGRSTITLAGAAGVMVMLALIGAGFGLPAPQWPALGWTQGAALLVFGVIGLALTQLLWIAGVGPLGIGLASLHLNAAPFYVMIFTFLLGAEWSWTQTFGALIVGLGVLIAQSRPALYRPAAA